MVKYGSSYMVDSYFATQFKVKPPQADISDKTRCTDGRTTDPGVMTLTLLNRAKNCIHRFSRMTGGKGDYSRIGC